MSEATAIEWLQLNLWWILLASTTASKICKAVLRRFFTTETPSTGGKIVWFLVDVFDLVARAPYPAGNKGQAK